MNYIEDEDIQEMHDAVYTKYLMFKYVFFKLFKNLDNVVSETIFLASVVLLHRKFKGAMHIVAIAETAVNFFTYMILVIAIYAW